MTIDAFSAANIYAQAAKLGAQTPAASGPTDGAQQNFGALVSKAATEAASSLKTNDAAVASVAAGEANLVDVVSAVSQAEISLETAIAVRNRMIEAYQEIMRMPI
jgi:flagellar hook-basal body complex protein FliE